MSIPASTPRQRLINAHSIEEAGGVNPYGYALNDPIDSIDPLGLINLFIYGAGPTGPGWSNDELTRMAQLTGGKAYGRSEKSKMIQDIKNAKANNPCEPVNIVGYSRGAIAANELATRLAKQGVGVNLLILLDPVTVTGNNASITASTNADQVTDYYQTNGGPFKGTPALGDNVINVNMTDHGSTHASMPSDVFAAIVNQLNGH